MLEMNRPRREVDRSFRDRGHDGFEVDCCCAIGVSTLVPIAGSWRGR
jgi:hypothetical protein